MDSLGIVLDNKKNVFNNDFINSNSSKVKIMVVHVNEDYEMFRLSNHFLNFSQAFDTFEFQKLGSPLLTNPL